MRYRVCKTFDIESGHMLSKHPSRCRYPHGHSRRFDIVLSSDRLDDYDMVCDFKAIKLAVEDYLDSWDHAMALNSGDEMLERVRATTERLIVFDNIDPTTEVMAKKVFEHLATQITSGETLTDPKTGAEYRFPTGLTLERVRVTETPTTWGEYGID